MAKGQVGRITDEAIAELRELIGRERPTYAQFNEYATKDTIRHFAYGMGDTNPLWTDEEYAKETRWGGIIAPPTFLFSMFGQGAIWKLPGVHGLWAGVELRLFQPIRLNEHIRSTVAINAAEEKKSEFAKRTVLESWIYKFRTDPGEELVGEAIEYDIRAERDTAREKGKYLKIEPHVYTEEELNAIEAEYDKEEIRGAVPRYWEDVQVGDELAHVIKGPLTLTDNIAWKIGWGFRPFVFAHRMRIDYRRRHPGAMVKNELGVPDVPERVHWDSEFARQIGGPAAYDYGPQRAAWLGQVMTNWMGDDGFLRHLDVRVRRMNVVGDTTWCRGKVTMKYVKDGEHMVECELWAENQRNETTAGGTATVVLPSRDKA